MNLIESYLKKEHYLDLDDKKDKASQDAKLEYFYRIFVDLEKNYANKLEENKRMESQHKDVLNSVEDYIHKVKELTEERERLTLDFKDENDELKNKIKALERELDKVSNHSKLNRMKSDTSEDSDELYEDLIEIMVLEGFGNIVEAPSHQKIATLLMDRRRIIDELNKLKKEQNNQITEANPQMNSPKASNQINSSHSSLSNISVNDKSKYEKEIETLKLVNDKLTNEIAHLKTLNENLDEINRENQLVSNENKNLKLDLIKLNEELTKLKSTNSTSNNNNNNIMSSIIKKPKSAQTSIEDEESDVIIEAAKFEISKLKEDNLNLKMEMDKLYDEIGSFELENKQLKDENKNLVNDMAELSKKLEIKTLDASSSLLNLNDKNKGNLEEIKKLKQEIEDLNNELDELIQYKANYESLKLDYDKLNATMQLSNDKTKSTNQLNSKTNSQSISHQQTDSLSNNNNNNNNNNNIEMIKNKSQLELEWIRRENEKLLLDLEKVQIKLDEKIIQFNELKIQLNTKDEQMKEFINKYEKESTNEHDLLKLQKKILDLEHLLSKEKEERLSEIESNEERQKDLLKRNDQLWSQLTKMEQNYKDAMDIIRQQTERIKNLEMKINDYEKNLNDLDDLLKHEKDLNENLSVKCENIELKLNETSKLLDESKLFNSNLEKEHSNENEKNLNEIKNLNIQIEELNEKLKNMEKTNLNLKLEVDSLNKEKNFIIGQNENSHQKVLQDYLGLQEKYTAVNFQFNKLNKDNSQLVANLKEKENLIVQLESEKTQLNFNLKQENRDKLDSLEKLKQLEALSAKNLEKINELTDKLHRVEIQKSKLEVKAKELESMELKCDQIYNELNDKRETLSQVLEKNGRLEGQISDLERQLNDTKHLVIRSESVINELNHYKSDLQQKLEEHIKLSHDFENEKSRREKAELKIEELKEEYKKQKQKFNKLVEENSIIKRENVETKNQLESIKSKLDLIADKSHTELEKNSVLQDELSETRKKLELAEMKCSTYSQKFDILLKKYETRKIKQKNKIERLWEYLQRERAKYKDLLANAQKDLTNTKTFLEKENEFKSKQESTYQQMIEEKSKLIATMVDKDSKIREMKRQNVLLQSKIKLLEEEMENLHEKVETTLKERNKLRKELQMNLTTPVSIENLDTSNTTQSVSPTNPNTMNTNNNHNGSSNLTRPISTDQIEKSFKSNSFNPNYWNEINFGTASWDINYNTGSINKYYNNGAGIKENKANLDVSLRSVISNYGSKESNGYVHKATQNGETNYAGSMTNDLNSILSTPRSYRGLP